MQGINLKKPKKPYANIVKIDYLSFMKKKSFMRKVGALGHLFEMR